MFFYVRVFHCTVSFLQESQLPVYFQKSELMLILCELFWKSAMEYFIAKEGVSLKPT